MLEVVTIKTPPLGDRTYLAADGAGAVMIDPPGRVHPAGACLRLVTGAVLAASVRITVLARPQRGHPCPMGLAARLGGTFRTWQASWAAGRLVTLCRGLSGWRGIVPARDIREASMTWRKIGRGVLDALSGVPLFVVAPLGRRWHLRWGATDEEVRGAMPGDQIIGRASFTATRAITIDAPPGAVWPWIVQMGYRRAGFYTYDLLDNAGVPSADRVLPQYQHLEIGDRMPMAAKITDTTAFTVEGFEIDDWLLWQKPDSTWAWKLVPLDGGRTRLISRLKQRYPWERPGSASFTLVLLEFGDFPMMRRVLTGIKARAEKSLAAQESGG